MPFIANTPESLVRRTDSKNPTTTCRGITSGGRPCRRPLVAADAAAIASFSSRRRGKRHVDNLADERLYCWQHKEQASLSARPGPGQAVSAVILEERTSIDTLADRLGLMGMSSTDDERPPFKIAKPSQPERYFSFCCCFQIPLDIESAPSPSHPRPRPAQPSNKKYSQALQPTPGATTHGPSQGLPERLQNGRRTAQTTQHLSLISPSASAQTASALMAELAKPISETDEAGYIYMFWLTPESQRSTQPADVARSLLTPPSGDSRHHRASDIVASFAAAAGASAATRGADSGGSADTLLLKIGRANNVQRRLNEWKRQCGYSLSLIRYYPYLPSSSSGPRSGAVPRKMPHSHKVERLIHIELAGAGLRVKDGEKCEVCGREHREWFEIKATRTAVMEVDDIIRHWSDWDEGRLGKV